MKKYNICVVGATGIIGREIIKILAERKFPINNITALASEASLGKKVSYGISDSLTIENLENYNFSGNDIVFFAAGSNISKEYVKKATKCGCIVIDNSSYFRLKKDIPLIIPEINEEEIANYKKHNIIANPNCSTIQLLVPLKPLHDFATIKRITVSTYQSTSGAGKSAMDELYEHTKQKFVFKDQEPVNFKKSIVFNCIPQIGEFDSKNHSEEENKIIEETKKIFKTNSIEIEVTCVRVPVFTCHAEAVTVEFKNEISIKDVYEILKEEEGVIILEGKNYNTQIESVGYDVVFASRIRQNSKKVISMWLVTDNLRKGAALNAVQIAEKLCKDCI